MPCLFQPRPFISRTRPRHLPAMNSTRRFNRGLSPLQPALNLPDMACAHHGERQLRVQACARGKESDMSEYEENAISRRGLIGMGAAAGIAAAGTSFRPAPAIPTPTSTRPSRWSIPSTATRSTAATPSAGVPSPTLWGCSRNATTRTACAFAHRATGLRALLCRSRRRTERGPGSVPESGPLSVAALFGPRDLQCEAR